MTVIFLALAPLKKKRASSVTMTTAEGYRVSLLMKNMMISKVSLMVEVYLLLVHVKAKDIDQVLMNNTTNLTDKFSKNDLELWDDEEIPTAAESWKEIRLLR